MTYSQLSQEERFFLSSLQASGVSVPQIAKALGRAPSTVYRELSRYERPSQGRYTPFEAHSYATARRRRERRGSQYPPECWNPVYELLDLQWSPEQIAWYLENHDLFTISFQTIYAGSARTAAVAGHSTRISGSCPSAEGNGMAATTPEAFYEGNATFPSGRPGPMTV